MYQFDKELTPIRYDSSALKILHFTFPPGEKCFRAHWHDRLEFLRIRQGEMVVECNSRSYKVSSDHMVIIPPHTPHKAYAGDLFLEYDVLMFDIRSFYNDTEICKTYLPAIYDGRAKFTTISDSPQLLQCMDKICVPKGPERNYLEITADLYRYIYLLFEHCLVSFDNNTNADKGLKEFTQYIEDNYCKELSTASLSAHFGYTASHFCRKFKKATGLTPANYIKIYRVEKAYKMIKEGNRDISRIAALCGFPDANYFTRCFKSHFGVPPSSFIKHREY